MSKKKKIRSKEAFEELMQFGRNPRMKRCQAFKKGTNDQCKRPAASGKAVCGVHGGKTPRKAPKPIEKPMSQSVFKKMALGKELFEAYEAIASQREQIDELDVAAQTAAQAVLVYIETAIHENIEPLKYSTEALRLLMIAMRIRTQSDSIRFHEYNSVRLETVQTLFQSFEQLVISVCKDDLESIKKFQRAFMELGRKMGESIEQRALPDILTEFLFGHNFDPDQNSFDPTSLAFALAKIFNKALELEKSPKSKLVPMQVNLLALVAKINALDAVSKLRQRSGKIPFEIIKKAVIDFNELGSGIFATNKNKLKQFHKGVERLWVDAHDFSKQNQIGGFNEH